MAVNGALLFLKIYALLLNRDSCRFHKDDVERILVYSYTGLGNFIQFTPALKRLREALPLAHITLQEGAPWGAEQVLSESSIFDEIVWFPFSRSKVEKLRFIIATRRKRYHLIISAFDNSRNRFLALETLLSGAKYRLGHVFGDGYDNRFGFVFNIKVPVREGRHEIDLKCDLVGALAISVTDRRPWLFVDAASRESAACLLAEHKIGKDFVCIQPGAANGLMTAKRWDDQRFVDLINRIVRKLGVDVVLLGDKNEVGLCASLQGHRHSRVHLLAGKTTIKEVAAVIQKARLLICNDSGLMHVATAVGTPLVAIYGPTDYRRTAPRGEHCMVVRRPIECSPCILFRGEQTALNCSHKNCIRSVSVDDVFQAVCTLLARTERGIPLANH